ncbi:MAG: NnrU family protein [Woeseiaceae bacterium]|nr:NnrU family protein [Woeseiaceae bacterium]
MTLLIVGVLLWSVVHLFPAIAAGPREQLVVKLGLKPYKGLFALAIVVSLVLIVLGWRSAELAPVYAPPFYGSPIVTGLMVVSMVLFAAASAPGNIKRRIRHPMLTGAMVWAIAHLLANGDNRSVVLFGGLGVWALLSILFINRRDGAWENKPAAVDVSKDIMTIVGAIVVFAVIVYFHETVFGVSAIPRLSP